MDSTTTTYANERSMAAYLAQVAKQVSLQEYVLSHADLVSRGDDGLLSCLCPRCRIGKAIIAHDNSWSCETCHAQGSTYDFAADLLGISFKSMAGHLAQKKGMPRPAWSKEEHADELRALYDSQGIFTSNFSKAQAILSSKRRGTSIALANSHGLGFCPQDLGYHLDRVREGIRPAARSVGLLYHKHSRDYTWLSNRVTIPIHDHEGRLVAFCGWNSDAEERYRDTKRTPIFQAHSLLYGYRRAQDSCRRQGFVLVVEGFFDLLALKSIGVLNVVANFTSKLSHNQAILLCSLSDRVVMLYDGDKAGVEGAGIAKKLLDEIGLSNHIASLPEDHDPDDLIRGGQSQIVLSLINNAKKALNIT